MKAPEPDYYSILGLSQAATPAQIRKAYYRLAKIHHPDKKAPGQHIDAVDFRKVDSQHPVCLSPGMTCG
jgi:curved DNA-binding protein CbpA